MPVRPRLSVLPTASLGAAFVRAAVLDASEGDAAVVAWIATEERRDEVVLVVPAKIAGAEASALRRRRRRQHRDRGDGEDPRPRDHDQPSCGEASEPARS